MQAVVYTAIFCILSISLFVSFNSKCCTFNTNVLDSESSNSTNSNISMVKIVNKSYSWDQLIECVVIHKKPPKECRDYVDINHLSSHTIKYLQNMKYSQFHKMISLRRKIMLIYELLNISKSNEYVQLLNYFKTINEYNNALQIKEKHKFYHIHFSKCAGTTIKLTLKTLDPNNKIFELVDLFNSNCSELYRTFSSLALTRENALFPISKLNKPMLCDEFIYIMPIRAPIERICSQTHQFNNPVAQISFLEQLQTTDFKSTDCNNWLIDGVPFKRLRNFRQYKNLYVNLLKSEQNELYKQYEVKNYEDVVQRIYKLSVSWKEVNISNECVRMNPAKYSKFRYFPLNINFDSDGKLKVNNSKYVIQTKRYNEQMWGGYVDISWLRTKMGSNLYTSYLGYSQQSDDECVVLSNYVKRESINFTHFMNAVKLMLEIDYILPMELYSNDDNIGNIWNISLEQITSFIQKTYGTNTKLQGRSMNWIHSNKAKQGFSRNICNGMSEDERQLLQQYNRFDIEIYKIARLIENVDVEFHLFNVP